MLQYFRELKVGETVKVYRNLNRSCWSVRDSKDHVIAHLIDNFILEDVTFVVRPAGKQLALKTGQRNFHAYAKGTYKGSGISLPEARVTKLLPEIIVTYSPWVAGGFVAHKEETDTMGFKVQCPNAKEALFISNGKVNIRI